MGLGYSGYARFADPAALGAESWMLVLCTGSSVNLIVEPIISNAVWGAGWYNAGRPAHYADAAVRYEGNIDIELQGRSSIWTFLREWSVENRAYPKTVQISPDGTKIYSYYATNPATYDTEGAWCSSISFSASEGSFVTSSIGLIAINRTQTDGDAYIDNKFGLIADTFSDFSDTAPLNEGGYNASPIAFWRTAATLQRWNGAAWVTPQSGLETVEWSVEVNNNTQPLYTMRRDRMPTAILQGPLDVTGNVTLYNTDGVFDPILGDGTQGTVTSPFLFAANTRLQVQMDVGSSAEFRIYLPAVIVSSDDYGIGGPDAIVNRTFSLTACAGTQFAPPGSTTTYVQPPIVYYTYGSPPLT